MPRLPQAVDEAGLATAGQARAMRSGGRSVEDTGREAVDEPAARRGVFSTSG